jgi:folate-binding protein YgfZ
VFSKVEISLVSLTGKIIGLFHEREIEPFANLPEPPPLADLPADDDAVVSGDDCIVIKLPAVKSKYQVISLNTKGDALLAKVLELAETATEAEWAMLDIEIGILHINEQDSEQFTPQLLNYDISGVIDFKKGCYTGQEIVARMFYRSTAKKRLQLLSSPLKADAADTIIYSEAGAEKTTGILRIANVPDSTGGSLILAILGMQAIDSLSPPRLLKAVPIEPAINGESFLQFLTLPYIK